MSSWSWARRNAKSSGPIAAARGATAAHAATRTSGERDSIAAELLQDVVEVAAAGRAGRGDRLPHDRVVAILQAAAQGLHPGGRQLPRGGAGHRLDQEEPGRGGGVLPPQCLGDELLDLRGLGEGQHRVAQPFPADCRPGRRGPPIARAGRRPPRPSPGVAVMTASTAFCRAASDVSRSGTTCSRVRWPPSIWSSATRAPRRTRGLGSLRPLRVAGRSAISMQRVDQGVIQEAIVLRPQGRPAGWAPPRFDSAGPAPWPRRDGRPARPRPPSSARSGSASATRSRPTAWAAAQPDAQVRIAERLAEGRPGLGGCPCA